MDEDINYIKDLISTQKKQQANITKQQDTTRTNNNDAMTNYNDDHQLQRFNCNDHDQLQRRRSTMTTNYKEEIDEESNTRKALQLQLQGQWTRWENYVKNDLSWKSLLAMPANLLSFCLASTYDVLPSPSNLKRWRICTESSCSLCSKEICTTAHVLGACKVSLTQGRFTFRHDSVLSELASILSSFIKALPPTPPKRLIKLAFVKAGKSVSKSKVKPTGILHLASDWVIVSDLQNSYIFPGHIALTSLRPDIVVFSNPLKRVILIELTCPCEENMESWHSIKLTKYSALVESILLNGWCVDLFAIEVRARGYCSRSATTCLKRLGFGNKLAFSTAKTLGQKSMESSFYIWLARNSRSWSQNATDLIKPATTLS